MKRVYVAVGALALTALVVEAPYAGSAQTAPAWPTFHGNGQRNGATTVNGPGELKHLNIWSLGPTSKGALSSPSVGPNGTAYIGNGDGMLYAFSPSSPSAAKWTFATGGQIADAPTVSNDGNTVFVGSDDGFVYGVNASTGAKVWAANLLGPVEGSPVLSRDGTTVFVASVNGTVEALSATNGAVKWSAVPGGGIRGNMALSADGSTLYAGTTTEQVLGIPTSGPSGGTGLSTYYTLGQPASSPAVDNNNNVYVTATDGSLSAYSPGASTPRWTFQIGTVGSFTTPAISANGTVYIGSNNGTVYAINASTGQQSWQARPSNVAEESSPAVAGNGNIYIGSDDGTLYALDNTGKQIASVKIGAYATASPAIAADGSVWMSAQSGQVVRLGTIAPPGTLPPVPSTNTPGPSPTPTNTATPGVTATASATATPTPGTLSLSAKAVVSPGQAQKVDIKGTAGAVVKIRVTYPNGDRQNATKTIGANGTFTYNFHQKASKITHTRSMATVTGQIGSGTTVVKASTRYKIGYGPIDISVEPRSVKAGSTANIYIHQKPAVRVLASIQFPNGRVDQKTGRPGPKGWAHIKYRVPKGVVRAGTTVKVVGRLYRGNPKVTTSSTLTIK